MSKVKRVFEQEMVWLTLGLLLLNLFSTRFYSLGTWDMHRTIGWGWSYPDFVFWAPISQTILLVIFTLGYAWVKFTKRKTHIYLSVFHFLALLIGFFTFPYLIYLLIIVSIFIANLFYSKGLEGS